MAIKKLRHGFKSWAERESVKFRTTLGLLPHQPLSGFRLAEFLGVRVLSPFDINSFPRNHATKLVNSDWSALTMITNSGAKIIIHNIRHNPGRQQSDLMHELSHIICGHEMPIISNAEESRLPLRHYNKEHENEAEWLGGNLQITRAGLLWALQGNMSISDMCNYFTASEDMVKYRIQVTGVKKQLAYRRNSSL